MRRRLLAAVGAVVVTAIVILSTWYVLSRPKDADGDGVLDANDAFPTNPDQSKDTAGDGWGDRPGGSHGDPFPPDPTEGVDSGGDGVGGNADAFATGNGAARTIIREAAPLACPPAGA